MNCNHGPGACHKSSAHACEFLKREKGGALKPHRTLITVVICASAILLSAVAAANPPRTPIDGDTAQPVQFGKVYFPISCQSQVQAAFNKGVAQLDNFQYEQSERTFVEVAKQDPHCAMAYWGQAMSLYHQLWEWPDASTIKKGRQLVQKAERSGTKSAREGEYIQAAEAYYQDDLKLDDEARAVAYSHVMASLHAHYPQDGEGAAFYALSLIAIRTPDKTEEMAHRKQAIAILDKLFVEEPDNPGVAHYLIHAADTPVLAPLGLKAARRYAKIAPGSTHALHMPSHIFTDLGLWQESIDSNIASAAAAEHATTSGEYNAWGHQEHAMTFLIYAYLQSGQNAGARHVILDLKKVLGSNARAIRDDEALFQAEYDTENHDWKQAAALTVPPKMYSDDEGQLDLARAVGAARSGNVTAAKDGLQELLKAQAATKSNKGTTGMGSSSSGLKMDQLVAEAWLADAEGNSDQALTKMQDAARMEDGTAWKEGQGGVQIPPREMLADLLMELHQPAKAFTEYQTVLKQSPNRFDSLYGAAQAAQAAGNTAAAHQYFAELVRICGPHADRPELRQAREYLAEK